MLGFAISVNMFQDVLSLILGLSVVSMKHHTRCISLI